MRLFPLYTTLILVTITAADPHASPNRIIDGQDVLDRSDWSFVASLRYRTPHQKRDGTVIDHFCGASIISENSLLTAAHCLVNKSDYRLKDTSQLYVYLGDFILEPKSAKAIYEIEKISVHEGNLKRYRPLKPPSARDTIFDRTHTEMDRNYNRNLGEEDDIALIRIRGRLRFGDEARGRLDRVCLPGPDAEPEPICKVAGWGLWKDSTGSVVFPNRLQQTQLPLTDCSNVVGSIKNAETKICAGGETSFFKARWGSGYYPRVCPGDSGSPLVCSLKHQPNIWLLYGIASMAPGENCNAQAPARYTRVSSFLPWIRANL